jgi:hypothetical protein
MPELGTKEYAELEKDPEPLVARLPYGQISTAAPPLYRTPPLRALHWAANMEHWLELTFLIESHFMVDDLN